MAEVRVLRELAEQEGRRVLESLGAPSDIACLVTRSLLDAEDDGYPGHGLARLIHYVHSIRTGRIKPAARSLARQVGPGSFSVDARRGFGAVALAEVATVIEKYGNTGPMIISVRNSGHFGRLAPLARQAASMDLALLGFANCGGGAQTVVPPNGTEPRLATNPIGFGFPAPDGAVVVDLSTSAWSHGHVIDAIRRGTPIPDAALATGGDEPPAPVPGEPTPWLAPLGGIAAHKGYALSIMVELLAGVVGGPDFVQAGRHRAPNAALFVTFPVTALGRSVEDVRADVATLERYLGLTPTSGDMRVRLPGRRPDQPRPTAVVLPEVVWTEIRKLARDEGSRG